jgi:hypothetical protein
MKSTAVVTGGKPIAVWSQSISVVSAAVNYLLAFATSVAGKERFISFILSRTRDTLLFPTLIPRSGVGPTCFHHVVIRHLFLRPAVCLTSTLLETGVDTNDCKCSRDQHFNVPSEARRSSRRETWYFFCFDKIHFYSTLLIPTPFRVLTEGGTY